MIRFIINFSSNSLSDFYSILDLFNANFSLKKKLINLTFVSRYFTPLIMKIESGKTALVQYKLVNADNESLIESTSSEQPATFKFGNQQLMPEFENNLINLTTGDSFDFIIKANDAYGPKDPYAIFDIPLDTFEVDGKVDVKMIKIGNVFPMTDNDGNKHMGKITKVMKEAVTMDFNHPLAGKNLRFSGKVIEVKS